jgi:hypothetical protein
MQVPCIPDYSTISKNINRLEIKINEKKAIIIITIMIMLLYHNKDIMVRFKVNSSNSLLIALALGYTIERNNII